MTIFITRPEHDDTTFYLSSWARETIETCKHRGLKVIDSKGERANAAEVEKVLAKQRPKFVWFNGHGSPEQVCGHKNEPLIQCGKNESLLKGKITYALSCNSAAKLGADSVEAGALAYLGYDDVFAFAFDTTRTAEPLKDDLAKPFFEASNELVTTLLKGNTAMEAFQRSQAKFDDWIQRLQRSNAPPEAKQLLWWLIWDKFHQKCLGNPDARL